MSKQADYTRELERIRQANGGVLQEEAVVAEASNPTNVLHPYFIWDDTEAAARYRLLQAQALIRLTVILQEGSAEPVRMYVSLTVDRRGQGGYRHLIEVLGDKEQHARMLADALAELQAFQQKYARLSELKPIFAQIQAVDQTVSRRQRKQAKSTVQPQPTA